MLLVVGWKVLVIVVVVPTILMPVSLLGYKLMYLLLRTGSKVTGGAGIAVTNLHYKDLVTILIIL
jgi:hypothetical protein